MALPDELIKLIKAEVARQLTHADRLKIGCIEGKGGNTVITSNGDILLRTLAGKKAYYNGTEIVAMSAPGDVVKDTATNNKLLKWTDASTKRAGNSNISDDGTNVTVTLGSGGKLVVTS